MKSMVAEVEGVRGFKDMDSYLTKLIQLLLPLNAQHASNRNK